MQESLLLEEAKERHERLIRDAQTVRRALRATKVSKSLPILKSLIIFVISVA
jgi:hypothetical protein